MGRIIKFNGNEYELRPDAESPTMYIWAAAHVVGPEGIQWNDFESQTKFVEANRFPVVLHEFFLDVIYDPKNGLFTKRDIGEPTVEFQRRLVRSPDILLETNAIKDLADRLGHKVIGCDSRATEYLSVPDEEREIEQAEVIEKYNGTLDNPHLAIIGAIHCIPRSHLNTLLQQKGIEYTIIHKLEYA